MARRLFEHFNWKGYPKSSAGRFKGGLRFGDGNGKTENTSVTIPARIGNEDIMIKTYVIHSDLPFLLSKEAMKKGDIKIDFARAKVSFLNHNVEIVFTSIGHY